MHTEITDTLTAGIGPAKRPDLKSRTVWHAPIRIGFLRQLSWGLWLVGLILGNPVCSILAADVTDYVDTSAPTPLDAPAAQKKAVDHYEANFKLVEMLLTKSSVAAAVNVANQEPGSEQEPTAQYYFEKAKDAHKAGNKPLAAEYLEKAKKAMLSAGRKVGAKSSHDEKLRKDYQKRVASTESILDALKRVNQEKQPAVDGNRIEQQISAQLAVAEQFFKAGDLDKANQQANSTFLLAKQSMINLRDGDTLVRSLNFANKEEEYRYELDRNATHKLLVTLLLQDKLSEPTVKAQVDQHMASAESLRADAAAQAKSGGFELAVQTLEKSTQKIIHAIRAAGIYIPG